MAIQPVPRRTLTDVVVAKITRSILDGTFEPGTQLPPERELMGQLGVSRSTLRESLKTLAHSGLIKARPGVGWFVQDADETNFAKLREFANRGTEDRDADKLTPEQAPLGPRRLPVAPDSDIVQGPRQR